MSDLQRAYIDALGRNPLDDPDVPPAEEAEEKPRRVRLTPASTIAPKPVRWLWEDRVPVGEVTLTPGKGGIGKSTFHAWLIAKVTTGTLAGVHHGRPRACIVAAAEDSWERTIVPRLIAAGADLDRVYRVDVVTDNGVELTLTMPGDVPDLEHEMTRLDVALMSVDPLMSTIARGLDTYKDREVREALEPLAQLADRARVSVLGNAHFNKSGGSDPLSLITGSAAFGNVVRAVLGFARDSEADDDSCVISQVKNNLGRTDLPSLRYVIRDATVETEEGDASVGRLSVTGTSDRSVADILSDRGDDGDKSERSEAQEWLKDYLDAAGGEAPATDVIKAGKAAGLSENAVKKARIGIKAKTERSGFGKGASYTWVLHGCHGFPVSESGTHGTHGESMESSPGAESAEEALPERLCQGCGESLLGASKNEYFGRRHYGCPEPEDLPATPNCRVCGERLHTLLVQAGETVHHWCKGEAA